MEDQYSTRDFLKSLALAAIGSSLPLTDLANTNEAEAHPPTPFIGGPRNYFRRPLYFGRHTHNHFGVYNNHHGGHSSHHQGLLVRDLALWGMFWGNEIRNQGRQERIIRSQRNDPNYDCRVRIEKPQAIPQTFLANCYEDTRNNDHHGRRIVNFPDEFPGIGKTVFREDEMITFGARLPINGISGKELDLRIYKRIDDEPRRRITKNTQKVPYDNYVIWKFFNPGSLAKQGFGEYEFETRFDGKPWNTHKFEIIPSKKVIAEPLGIFKQRPR